VEQWKSPKRMRYTIYKVTNTINGKIYIGKHQTENPYDDYLGSGIGIRRAINYYGKHCFIKEVLFDYNTEEEMNAKEKELVTEEFVRSKNTYNCGVGGEGGPQFKNKKHKLSTKIRLSEYSKTRRHSAATRKKISEANSRRRLSIETREKLSQKAKERFSDPTERDRLSKIAKQTHSNRNRNKNNKESYVRTDEHLSKMKEVMRKAYAGKKLIWMKNPATLESVRIEEKDYHFYIAQGFIKGRILK
jgi:hypothetical protein